MGRRALHNMQKRTTETFVATSRFHDQGRSSGNWILYLAVSLFHAYVRVFSETWDEGVQVQVCSGLVKCHVRVTRTVVRVIKTGAICLYPFARFCLLFFLFSFSTCFYHPDPCPCHPDMALYQPTAYSLLYPFVFPKRHARTHEKVRQPRIRLFSCLMIDPGRETGL